MFWVHLALLFKFFASFCWPSTFSFFQVLSMSKDDYRNASFITSGSFDQDFPIPDLIGPTEILSEDHRWETEQTCWHRRWFWMFHREKLCSHLPARAEGYSWSLVFSTSQHGFSLNSLYRKMHKLESPILIVIEDTEKNVSQSQRWKIPSKALEVWQEKLSSLRKKAFKFEKKAFKFCQTSFKFLLWICLKVLKKSLYFKLFQVKIFIFFHLLPGFWCSHILFAARFWSFLRHGRIASVQVQPQLQSFPLEWWKSLLHQGKSGEFGDRRRRVSLQKSLKSSIFNNSLNF